MGQRRVLTKSGVVSSCPAYSPGLYTAEEIDQKVFVEGWTPIASVTEFNFMKTTSPRTSGIGTCWEGVYPHGMTAKYLLVNALDFGGGGIQVVGRNPTTFQGEFDGNELLITNGFTADAQFKNVFGWCTNATMKNIRVSNITMTSGNAINTGCGVFGRLVGCIVDNCIAVGCTGNNNELSQTMCGGMASYIAGGIVSNCHVIGYTFTDSSDGDYGDLQNQGLGGFCGLNVSATIENCSVDSTTTLTATSDIVGGFTGRSRSGIVRDCSSGAELIGTFTTLLLAAGYGGFIGCCMGGTFLRCHATGNVSATASSGGFCGLMFWQDSVCTFEECYATGDVTVSSNSAGGFSGYARIISATYASSNFTNCWASGDATVTGGNAISGGFIGDLRNGGFSIVNCYSTGAVSAGSFDGGFVGRSLDFTGSVTNCYWDTDTSGILTSPEGTGQTTVALQTPTSNTGIYSAWTIPPWDFGTSSDYPLL